MPPTDSASHTEEADPAGEEVGDQIASWVSGDNDRWDEGEEGLAAAVTVILTTDAERDTWLTDHSVPDDDQHEAVTAVDLTSDFLVVLTMTGVCTTSGTLLMTALVDGEHVLWQERPRGTDDPSVEASPCSGSAVAVWSVALDDVGGSPPTEVLRSAP